MDYQVNNPLEPQARRTVIKYAVGLTLWWGALVLIYLAFR